MKLVKFHMLLHIVDDIERLGSPQNTNGAPCESNFKPQKKESVRTQRRAKVFHEQIAIRIHDQILISRASKKNTVRRRMQGNRLVSGSKFKIKYCPIEMNYSLDWNSPVKKKQIYDKRVIEFVYDVFFDSDGTRNIHCFTEHKINREIFRGDCSYRGDSEWYDWANILWDDNEDNTETRPILGKIHMFVDCTKYEYNPLRSINGLHISGGEIYAVISSLT